MTASELIIELSKNQKIIESLLVDVHDDFIHYRHDEHTWSPLIVICHLVDEEKEDFRARIKHLIAYPEKAPPSIDPEGWVAERGYADQDFQLKLSEWLKERAKSLAFLKTVKEEDYSKGFDHKHFGRFTVGYLISNWLAHDLLHIRQLTRIRYRYLEDKSAHSIQYAGKW